MRKRICDPFNLFFLNGYHIIADSSLTSYSVAVPIVIRHPADPPLFALIHRLHSTSFYIAAAVFYLHEYQIILMPSNQVDFSQLTPEIVFHDPHTLPFQVVCSLYLLV